MMSDAYTLAYARQVFKCDWCGTSIPVAGPYYWRWSYDAEAQKVCAVRVHLECKEAEARDLDADDVMPQGCNGVRRGMTYAESRVAAQREEMGERDPAEEAAHLRRALEHVAERLAKATGYVFTDAPLAADIVAAALAATKEADPDA